MATVLSVCLLIFEFRKTSRVIVFGYELSLFTQLCIYLWVAAHYVVNAGLLKAVFSAAAATSVLAFFYEALQILVKQN